MSALPTPSLMRAAWTARARALSSCRASAAWMPVACTPMVTVISSGVPVTVPVPTVVTVGPGEVPVAAVRVGAPAPVAAVRVGAPAPVAGVRVGAPAAPAGPPGGAVAGRERPHAGRLTPAARRAA